MVFFTSLLIVLTLYYLQTDGLIYVTIIAVVAELANILLTQTLAKAVEKKSASKFGKIITGYQAKIAAQKKALKELENIREESVKKLYKANLKIREYEERLDIKGDDDLEIDSAQDLDPPPAQDTPPAEQEKEKPEKFVDLPSGSNRKRLNF